MLVNMSYQWFMNSSSTLSIIADNVSKSLERMNNEEKIIYNEAIEKSIFTVFNTLSKIQNLDNGLIKKVVYDSESSKEIITKAFSIQLEKQFNKLDINPSIETITTIVASIQKEIIKYSAQQNNIVLDSNLEIVKEKVKNSEQELIFQHNNNVNPNDTVIQLQVEFKTGNLIVTDYLHIPELEEITKTIESGQGSLNDHRGRHERTKRLVQHLNIISVCLGDVGPSIFKKEDTLIFGSSKKENTFEKLGSIQSYFWGTSIYEKENILDLLTIKVGEDKAKKILNKILKQDNVITVNVNPGFYQVTVGDFFEDFSKDVKSNSIKIPNATNLKPWFTVEKIDLTPKPKKTKTKIV